MVSMVVHTLAPGLWRQKQGSFYEFETRFIYIMSSRPGRIHSEMISKQTNQRNTAIHF